MISITGSEAAGVEVAKSAAGTVKRVCQELGGKSANIILDDADFAKNVAKGRYWHDGQFRPDLQRNLAHARAQTSDGRGHPRRPRGRLAGDA
jgi:acyl-CoA reductase-like NAD-dependent aldehyde dehydrogenase